ncbi:MAG: YbhB/YbcL family Raf kinase inhibitor-like protein [Nitrospinota bacterium]
MELKSDAFDDGETISTTYIMKEIGGENISLPFEWSNAPAETKSFAFSIVDPHPVANNWVHWFVINIPAGTNSIEEGASGENMPAGSMELNNTYGSVGYGGPQPPARSGDHPYVCTVYALSVDKLDLGANVSLSDFKKALEGKILAQATTTGNYGR